MEVIGEIFAVIGFLLLLFSIFNISIALFHFIFNKIGVNFQVIERYLSINLFSTNKKRIATLISSFFILLIGGLLLPEQSTLEVADSTIAREETLPGRGVSSLSEQKEQERKEQEEKERKEQKEQERKEQEEKERKEQEEQERKEQEEKERKEQEEQERKEQEEKERKEQKEQERKEQEEKERKEQKEQKRKEQEEKERKEQEEQERKEQEEKERKKQEEKERKEQEIINQTQIPNSLIANVVRVVDGDTIIVSINGNEERVRFLLIDTPETVHPSKPVEPFGPEASNYVKSRLEGNQVILERDVSERDRYNRLLFYVYDIDGNSLQEELLERGLARVSIYPPDIKHVDRFREIQSKAKQQSIGIWSLENYTQEEQQSSSSSSQGNQPPATSESNNSEKPLIKGNISSSGEKIYHVPGGAFYDRTIIDESAGERWFYTESEAREAGWRRSKR